MCSGVWIMRYIRSISRTEYCNDICFDQLITFGMHAEKNNVYYTHHWNVISMYSSNRKWLKIHPIQLKNTFSSKRRTFSYELNTKLILNLIKIKQKYYNQPSPILEFTIIFIIRKLILLIVDEKQYCRQIFIVNSVIKS